MVPHKIWVLFYPSCPIGDRPLSVTGAGPHRRKVYAMYDQHSIHEKWVEVKPYGDSGMKGDPKGKGKGKGKGWDDGWGSAPSDGWSDSSRSHVEGGLFVRNENGHTQFKWTIHFETTNASTWLGAC